MTVHYKPTETSPTGQSPSPCPAEERTLSETLRRATTLATLTAGFLVGRESVHAQQPSGSEPTSGQRTTLTTPGRERTADEQWKEWRKAFKGEIPTETLGLDNLQRLIRDTAFRVSEDATLGMSLSMLVGYRTGDGPVLSGDRLAAVARNSSTPLKEIETAIWKAYYANKKLEEYGRELLSLDLDINRTRNFRSQCDGLSEEIKALELTITELQAERLKFTRSLTAVMEAETLLNAQASGRAMSDDERRQLKVACRRVGVTSLKEVAELKEALSTSIGTIDARIKPIKKAKEKTADDLRATLPLADAEECEHFERALALTQRKSALEQMVRKFTAETDAARNRSVSSFIDPDKRETFRLHLSEVEVQLDRMELVAHNRLGNPSAKIVLERGLSYDPNVLIATNEAGAIVTARQVSERVVFTIGNSTPLTVRQVNPKTSLQNFLEGRDTLVFEEKSPVSALDHERLKYLSSIALHLCNGSRFDMSDIGAFNGNILPLGGGVVMLGHKPSEVIRQPRIRVTDEGSSELVTISIPAGEKLSPKSMTVERYEVSLDLQALVTVRLRAATSDTPGADVNIEVRGKNGSKQIPFVRGGKLVEPDIEAFIAKLTSVK